MLDLWQERKLEGLGWLKARTRGHEQWSGRANAVEEPTPRRSRRHPQDQCPLKTSELPATANPGQYLGLGGSKKFEETLWPRPTLRPHER